MGHIRTIKPEFFTDEKIIELSPIERLAFVGLWTQADRAGRLEDNSRELKMRLFPEQKVRFDSILNVLSSKKFIQRYTVDGLKLIQIRCFDKHQRPHPTEKESSFPPCNGLLTVSEPFANQVDSDVRCLITEGREGKGKEGKGRPTNVTMEDFETFWKEYPNKKSKGYAERCWKAHIHELPPLAEILSILYVMKCSNQWQKDNGKWIPMPSTWLNGKRWLDEIAPKVMRNCPKPDDFRVPDVFKKVNP